MQLMIRVHEDGENAGLGGAVRICSEGTQLFLHLNQVVLHWLKWLEGDPGYEKDDVATPARTSGVGGRDEAGEHDAHLAGSPTRPLGSGDFSVTTSGQGWSITVANALHQHPALLRKF